MVTTIRRKGEDVETLGFDHRFFDRPIAPDGFGGGRGPARAELSRGPLRRPDRGPGRESRGIRDPGRFVVYVDSLFLGPARRDRVFSQLIETMGESLNPRDEVMVVTFDGSLKIRSPFTRDRKRTYRALEEAAELDGIQISASLTVRPGAL